MKKVAEARDELPYMRPLKMREPGKKIFSEFIEGFICEALNLKRAKNINQDNYDAIVKGTGEKVQIKDTTRSAPNTGEAKFDYLITVKLKKGDFSIDQIAVFQKKIVKGDIGVKKDFRFKKKHGKFIVYKEGMWLKKEIP